MSENDYSDVEKYPYILVKVRYSFEREFVMRRDQDSDTDRQMWEKEVIGSPLTTTFISETKLTKEEEKKYKERNP